MWSQPRQLQPKDISLLESLDIFLGQYLLHYNSIVVFFQQTIVEKLPKPYETQCQEYGNSNRQYCLNNCYIDGYLDEYDCIPNHNRLHTLIIDDNSTSIKFCDPKIDLKNIEIILKKDCDSKCGDPCNEILFDSYTQIIRYESGLITHEFIIKEATYTKIKYIAEMYMIDLIVRLFNIWNLWHGTHLLQIIAKFNQWMGNLLRKLNSITSNYNNNFNLAFKLKNFKKVIFHNL